MKPRETNENMDNITIPGTPMGGDSVPPTTTENDLASYIFPAHRGPLLLAISLYNKPILTMSGWILVREYLTGRVGVWYRATDDQWVVGCKGTQLTGDSAANDMLDDTKIAFNNYCDLTLVEEATEAIEKILAEDVQVSDIMVVGHSLGGTAALCVASKYGTRCVSFNGGAAPTNPVLDGPGPALATHYHVFGDLISSHMSLAAARVIRVKNKDSQFGTLYSHSSARMLASSGPFALVTADEEDDAYLKWGSKFKWTWTLLPKLFSIGAFLMTLKKYSVVKKSPIPGSKRALSMMSG